MPSKEPQIFIVEETESSRIDRWLKKQIPHLGQGLLEKFLRLGKIKLNQKKVKSSERVQSGDVISIYANLDELEEKAATFPSKHKKKEQEEILLTPTDISWLESLILWEDEDILVINKPSGLAVQGGSKTLKHVDGYLQAWGKIKGHRYRLVHRLDRDTSGVFLIAKTAEMATHLTDCFKQGNVQKTYWAVVLDQPSPGIGKVKAPLLKGAQGDKEKVFVDLKHGKKAVTIYRTVKRLQDRRKPLLSWLELNPETGRTHQIRVHCQYLGCPIIGDGKYGGKEATEISKTLHLHARSITIEDRYGNNFTFTAPPPSHFVDTLMAYKIEWSSI